MFTEEDKQILLDCAGTVESGLERIANAFPIIEDNTLGIIQAGESIERGLHSVASAIDRLVEAYLDK